MALAGQAATDPNGVVAQIRATSRPFTGAWYGAQISTGDYAFKVVGSLDGTGAAITHVTSSSFPPYPDIGKSTTTIYFGDRVSKQEVTFRQDAPNANGISRFTGHRKCAGGSGVHKHEKCTYTITGTYNVKTSQSDLKIVTGTDTLRRTGMA